MTSRPRVLVDSTPLLGESVLHGIGRYTYDLLHGLAETRAEWEAEARIEALVDLRWVRRARASEDLAAVAEDARVAPRDMDWPLIARRWATLGRAALERRARVVHLPQARGLPLLLPVRSVVTCHDLIPLRFPREYIGGAPLQASRWARDYHRYRLPTRVVAISDKTRSELALLRVPPERIDVVPNGIDLAHWSAPPDARDAGRRAALGADERPYVLYVGYCDHRKNVPGMLAALAIARRSADVELVWAGDLPPPKLAAMKALTRGHGVERAVRFLGFVADADLAALYRGAVGLLFLSRLEGFGLPVAEAMASGCPSIVARSSGSDDVAGDAGIVLDGDDVAGAADAILRLTRRGAEREALVLRGNARVVRFDRREMARGYVRSYLRALA